MSVPREFPYHRVAERMFNTPLMIHPGRAKIIGNVLAARMGLPAVVMDGTYEAAARTKPPATPGSIAIIPVHGTLVHRSSWMSALSGLVSYEELAANLNDALTDDNVSAVLFDFDTGGGEVAGCFDLVDAIHAARAVKPIWAVANEAAYSAGYALASACERVVLPRTAGVGSIGVICIHMDVSQADAEDGVVYTPIFAGSKKVDGWSHAPLSEEVKTEFQAAIDKDYDLFVSTVARNRGSRLTEAAARATEAGCCYGSDAVKLGLADAVATISDTLSELAALVGPPARGPSVAFSRNAMPKETKMAIVNAADQSDPAADAVPCPDCPNPDECAEMGACGNKSGAREAVVEHPPVGASIHAAVAEATAKFAAELDNAKASAFAAGKVEGLREGAEKGAAEALASAREIVAKAAAAGMPEMALDLLKSGTDISAAEEAVNAALVKNARASDVSTSHAADSGSFTISREDAKDFAKYRRVRDAAMAHGQSPIIVE